MARSSDINQRIVLTGADEVRRHLESIAEAGQRAGNTTRAALIAATQGASSFAAGARNAAASSGQTRFALQNLSFQANDIATSLASGASAMQVFAQQGGQVIQAIAQGGGLANVLRDAATAIRGWITPVTAAAAGVAALAGGIALLALRAVDSETSAKRFDAILKITSNSSRVTGQQLEDTARSFRAVGISAAEGREAIRKFLEQGGDPRRADQLLRIGAKLRDLFGDDSMRRFFAAAAQGGKPLEEFARMLGVVAPIAEDTSKQLEAAAASTRKFNDSVADLLRGRSRAIADEDRSRRQQIADLTRRRGTPEEEIALLSQRRVADIERQTTQQLLDLQRQRADQLAVQRAAELAKYNADIAAAAQAALDKGSGLLAQIEVALGRANAPLTPFQQAIRAVSAAWNDLLDTLAKSEFITQVINGIGGFVNAIKAAITFIDQLSAAIRNIPGLPAWLGGSGAGIGEIGARLAALPFTGGLIPSLIGGSAEGGQIRGPGTGTSDSILRRVSNGEFIVNAFATARNLPILQAINSVRGGMSMPQRRMPRGFAAGGLVGGGAGGGSPIFITFPDGGRAGPMMADSQVEAALVRRARRSGMLSAGRRPSTA